MKPFLILLGVAAAGVLGYLKEPALRFQLTGISPSEQGTRPPNPLESILAPSTNQIDLVTLTASQLPDKVALKTDIKFSDSASGLSMTVAAGSRVKLVRIDGSNVVVRPGDTPYSIVLPIAQTDLMDQLAAAPPVTPEPAPAATQEPAPAATPEPAPAVSPEPAPAVSPEPAPAVTPEPAPAATPEPAPAVMPEPAVEPKPEPEPTAETAPAAAGATDVVKIMQDSIRGAQIKEFTFDQVLDWNGGAEETVDGEAFQTGTVSYKAETIFGIKTIQAKALIKGGKVQRWIWPKSGMEIK